MTRSENNPDEVLFAESRRLETFVDFWGRRIDIEKTYLDNLSGLRFPDPPGIGQLQELAQKTRELLLDELEERRRGFARLNAAYKALTHEFRTYEGPSEFDLWGRAMKQSLLRMDSLATEVTAAASLTERLAVEARETENFPMPSSARKENRPRSSVFSRLLDKARNEKPYDTSSFLSADSTYRQKIQKLNDEKYIIQNEIVPQTVIYVEHSRKCIAALKHIVSVFSAVHSDLAQVLNVTSSELCIASSSVDPSMESASFSERLEESLASLISPCRYTSYEISSSLRPTTILFGCPLPDDLDGASIGERAVAMAFEAILSSAAKMRPYNLYEAMCNAHKQQGNDVTPSALQLESLWDPYQLNGGQRAVDFLAKAPSDALLVYFLERLPEPFLPLYDSETQSLAKLDLAPLHPVTRVFAEAGNRMGIARRYHLARFFLTLRHHQLYLWAYVVSHPEGFQIVTRTTDLLPSSRLPHHFGTAIRYIDVRYIDVGTIKNLGHGLELHHNSIRELRDAGLLT